MNTVKRLLEWKLEQSRRADFADRMVEELFRRGVRLTAEHGEIGPLLRAELAAVRAEAGVLLEIDS